jgi:hypothetical protein
MSNHLSSFHYCSLDIKKKSTNLSVSNGYFHVMKEEFEDTKWVVRIRISKNRQLNVPLVEQELFILPEHLSSPPV